ncbi:tail fiber domain-containing protein [Olleya sp. R77988]|uniref:tail fiber domain-containing protein n=1 Tax=Olleya sp. R77988 TaxID=3093875 RepID=UPI0037C91981
MYKTTLFLKGKLLLIILIMPFLCFSQVGIGLTNPTAQLTVNEDAIFNESGGNHDFRVESTTQSNLFFIDASTNSIGVNTSTPASQFQIVNNGNIGANALFDTVNSGTDGLSLSGYNTNATNGYNAIEGVTNGTYSGIFGLHIAATGFSNGVFGASNSSDAYGVYGSIPTTGTWFGFGGFFEGGLGYVNGLYNVSDARTKTNITPIKNALEKISSIGGYQYKYDLNQFNSKRSNNNQYHYGFLAQNIKQFLPHAVALKKVKISNDNLSPESSATNTYTSKQINVVDYTAIVPVLVEALKEQQVMIKNQNSKIETLEEKLVVLENKINILTENSEN